MKKYHILLLALCVCSSSMVFGQNKYSDQELQSFYKIYLHIANNPFETLQVMQSLLSKVNITEERMGEIMEADAMGKIITISEQEKKSLEDIRKLLLKEKEKYDAQIVEMIKKEKLSLKKYEEIKAAFLKDRQLQQRAQNLFEKNK